MECVNERGKERHRVKGRERGEIMKKRKSRQVRDKGKDTE
jgi:hypothetical protein